ncbi:tigger transposable element-derived protein 6-like [Bactrocera neohumeralis]|uniref:tigger transposable element-derived protein 6-like n=1 Tax=Bactrocera neohumeralis TaxID=98809 RepID=UPI0021662400|nr:tigger transposable element-derived protein 6-like [Bactrocera neohumeralis]
MNVLPRLIENYNANDILKPDETGLFFKCLPNKTLTFKNEQCFEGKQSKEKITVMVGSNMTGSEKLKLLVIGKAKNPRCFKGVKSLDVDYEFNKKAWKTSEIFTKWILKLDKKIGKQDRKVLLFVDNCTAHPRDVKDKLKNIQLAYFSPNMTSLLQPMDQGIIYNMKQHYRKRNLTNILAQLDGGTSVFTIDLLHAIRNLSSVWDVYVKPETIPNCFRKAEFSKDAMQNPSEQWDEEDLSIADLVALQSSFKKVTNIEASFEDYVNVDIDVPISENPSEEDILSSVLESRGVPAVPDIDEVDLDTEEEMADTDEALPTLGQVSSSINCIRTFVEMKSDVPINVFNCLNDLEAFVENEKWKNVIQTKLRY